MIGTLEITPMIKQPLAPRIIARLRRLSIESLQWPRIVIYRWVSSCRRVIGEPILNQPAQLNGAGTIVFKGKVNLGCYPSPFFLDSYTYIEARCSLSTIEIADGTWLNNGCVIISEYHDISIGRNVLMGCKVEILGSDFHGIDPGERNSSPENSAAICIGDNVFIGSNARIFKGVTIGSNTTIGNSAVVVNDIPENVVAAGNPARVVRRL